MAYDPTCHHRRSIRLPHHDYAQPGWYFVTICVQRHAPLLGAITDDGALRPSPAGTMATDWWHRLPDKFPCLQLDTFVAMPNHIHGLLCLHAPPLAPPDAVRADPRVRPITDPRVRPTPPRSGAHAGTADGGAHAGTC